MAHVVMLVHSDYYHDNRVVREAELLASEHYKVTVLAADTGLGEAHSTGYLNGVEIITCRLGAESGKKRFISMMRAYWKQLKHLRPDIVHAHDLDTLLPAWRFTRSRAVPLIYDSHELYLESTGLRGRSVSRFIWAVLERVLIHRTNAVITVCDSIARYLQSRYNLERKPDVIRNFSNRVKFSGLPINDLPEPVRDLRSRMPFVSVYQGVLREGRGLNLITNVVHQTENWGLIICGSGPMSGELQKKILQMKAADRIILTGQLPHTILAGVTGIADAGFCYIEPISLSYRYALPNKLSEYIQSGVPVIGSDLPEIRRLIDNFHAGFVCSNGDQIVQSLRKLEKPEVAEGIHQNLRKAAPLLSWEAEGKKLTELYETLI
ncbi:MAG: glycosyltransferase [Cyclonatronaceae bacterium]